jgi:hypothetical protein
VIVRGAHVAAHSQQQQGFRKCTSAGLPGTPAPACSIGTAEHLVHLVGQLAGEAAPTSKGCVCLGLAGRTYALHATL